MSANNPVFQVLVAPNDTAGVLAAGNPVTSLLATLGQIGVFDYKTGLSLNAGNAAASSEVFVAMSIDTDGDGVADDIVTSAGTKIQKAGVSAYTLKCYSPDQPHIVDITDFTGINCETDYAFKVEFRGNSQAYQNFGFNQFAKTFAVKTGCCGPECDCPSGDCNELAVLFAAAVNADTDGILTAQIIDYTTTPGTPVEVLPANVAAWVANPANTGLCLGVRLITNPIKLYTYCQVPARYYKMMQFKIVVSTIAPLDCKATVTTFQEPAFGEGQGKDIGWLEYEAGGYNGKPGPYRVGELAGLPIGDFQRLSQNNVIYNQVNLMYRNESVAGWDEHKNYMNTIIAVPCTSDQGAGVNATLNALLPILDAFLAGVGYDALDAGDIDQCNCATDTVVFTSDIDNVANDGLA